MLVMFGGQFGVFPAGFFAPKHYLGRWHPENNGDAAQEPAKMSEFDHWSQAFRWKAGLLNSELPVLTACLSRNRYRATVYWK